MLGHLITYDSYIKEETLVEGRIRLTGRVKNRFLDQERKRYERGYRGYRGYTESVQQNGLATSWQTDV